MIVSVVLPASGQENSLLIKLKDIPASLGKVNSAHKIQTGFAQVDRVLQSVSAQTINPVFSPAFTLESQMLSKWIKVVLPANQDIYSAMQQFSFLDQVEYCSINRPFKLHYVPNDPKLDEQWALAKIDAFSAWEIERGRDDVIVAVIDTGIEYDHPDLKNNVWVNETEDLNGNGTLDDGDLNGLDDDGNGFVDDVIGWDFTDAPNYPDGGDYLAPDNDPMDELGHGTSVSGIIAAEADNGIGISGLASNCKIMGLRAFTAGGNGEEDDVASAILYAIENGAKVINMSWGDVFVSRVVDDIIRYAASKGVVLVASAGNSATDQIHYPSGFEGTISVGATNQDDLLAGFSNFGPTMDLVAPGVDILSTGLDHSYSSNNGTSFSAPFVSAAAVLLLSQSPDLSADAIKGTLLNSTDDIGNRGWDELYAAGRLNINSALNHPLYSIVEIKSPHLDQGFSVGPVELIGSAWSPTLSYYSVSYGEGDNPDEWIEILTQNKPVLDGSLGTWGNLPSIDGSYMLKVEAVNRDGSIDQDFVRIFIDKTPPVISNLELLPMLDGDSHSLLISFETDDLCEGSLFFRPAGTSVDFDEALLSFRTNTLRYNLKQSEINELAELKINARNQSGLSYVDDNNSELYQVDLSKPPIDVTSFSPTNRQIQSGHILPRYYDFNGNGKPEIIVGTKQDGAIGLVKFFEFDGFAMSEVFTLGNTVIPRDIGDSDGDGKYELLCGYGFNSYLYEASEIGKFPDTLIKEWTGDGAFQYWASRIADLDSDGKGEIILRVVSSGSNTADMFVVEETTGDNSYAQVAAFENPTDGENQNGVPHCEFGDFDNDGAVEILLGDSDGDLYIYEATGDNTFVPTWQYKMPLLDTIDFITVGDFNGDRITDFAAGCHSDPNLNTEHDYDARHWVYRIFGMDGDNSYKTDAEYRVFGFESPKDFDSGMSSGDIDFDGDDELFLCAFPDLYVVDFVDENYGVSFYRNQIKSNSIVVVDVDVDGENEFWAGTMDNIQEFAGVGVATAPAVPVAVVAQPLNESQIRLEWREIKGADHYIVMRGTSETNMREYAVAVEPTYLDEIVDEGLLYYYSITAVDFEKEPMVSIQSQVVRAQAGKRPMLLTAQLETSKSVRLFFSKALNSTLKNATNYWLNDIDNRPTTAIPDASGQQVVVNFAKELNAGNFKIYCKNLQDIYNTSLDTLKNSADFSVTPSKSVPYLISGQLVNENSLELAFSEEMAKSSLANSANYDVGENIQITDVTLDETSLNKVVLNIETSRAFGALGKSYTIRVKNLVSAVGVPMQSGRGDFLQLIFSEKNLDNVFTYPNPFRPDMGVETIMFANLTQQAIIEIFTSQGISIKTLTEENGDGGAEWDMKNNNGDNVASGIYIYRITSGQQTVMGKLAIVR